MNVIINGKKIKVVNGSKKLFIKNDEAILYSKKNTFNTFLKGNVDVLIIDHRNSIIFKYLNMPRFKIVSVNNAKQKTSILVLPKNTSYGLKIGDVLFFEGEHVI